MKPVFQDKFGGEVGNCLAACIASILEKPLRDVPNFMEFDKGNGEWFAGLFEYLGNHGLTCTFSYIDDAYSQPVFPLGRYHIISGISPRGFLHAVVGFNGKIVHDPHPEGGGLLTVADYMIIHRPDEDPWALCDPAAMEQRRQRMEKRTSEAICCANCRQLSQPQG